MKMKYKGILEGLLFASGEAGISLQQIAKVLDITEETALHLLNELKFDYEHVHRGISIVESNSLFLLSTKPEHSEYYKMFKTMDQSTKMSQATLEALSIVVYEQPVTKTEIDDIRGVQSGSAIQNLLQRKLIEIIGRKDTPGRPYLYGTTKYFLSFFGITSLDELPPLKEDMLTVSNQDTDLFNL